MHTGQELVGVDAGLDGTLSDTAEGLLDTVGVLEGTSVHGQT